MNIFQKLTKKAVIEVKAAVKDEAAATLEDKLPMILGLVTIGVTIIACLSGSSKPKNIVADTKPITINIYTGGKNG